MALTTGLKAYWKLDESSGNAADSTGNGNTLINNGSTTYTTGKINNCADFGASNSTKSLTLDSATPLGLTTTDLSTAFSVSIWLNQTTSVATVYPLTILCKNGSSRNTFGLVVNTNSLEYFVHDGTYNQYTSGSSLSNGTWIHYAVTYDGTTFRTYINGVAGNCVACADKRRTTCRLVGVINAYPGLPIIGDDIASICPKTTNEIFAGLISA